MSNQQGNLFNNNNPGAVQNMIPGQHNVSNQQPNQMPINTLNYGAMKQNTSNNSSGTTTPMSQPQSVNNYNQSANSSPAFNMPPLQSGMLPPMRPNSNPIPNSNPFPQSLPPQTQSSPYPPNFPQPNKQVNHIAPPLVSGQPHSQPIVNGPPFSQASHQFPPTSSAFPPSSIGPVQRPQMVQPPIRPSGPPLNQSNVPFSGSMSVPSRNSPVVPGPPISVAPALSRLPSGPMSGPSGPMSGPSGPMSGPSGPINGQSGPMPTGPSGPMSGPPGPMNGPPGPMTAGPMSGPSGPMSGSSGPMSGPLGPMSRPPGPMTGPSGAMTGMSGPISGTSGSMTGPSGPISGSMTGSFGPMSGPMTGPAGPMSGPSLGPPKPIGMNGPSYSSGGYLGPPVSHSSPLAGPVKSGPPMSSMAPSSGPISQPAPLNHPSMPYQMQRNGPPGPQSGPTQVPAPQAAMPGIPPLPNQQFARMPGPPVSSTMPAQRPMMPGQQPGLPSGPGSLQSGLQSGPQSLPPMPVNNGQSYQPGPPTGPVNSQPMYNMQNRYPPMASGPNQGQPVMDMSRQYQGVTQQMGQLSVTKQGFDQLWGHQMVDLMQCRHILPEYPEDPPEIVLPPQFAEAQNCSPEIFRCTVNRMPENNSLLQKSRLPLGILIHPFKDLNHLPVIQCATIVRCRACRTYINPFVYFVDSKRWKCNLCFRVNDLPEEFQYDPVSKSYGDPSRRPEVKSATIEFIAPGEYMLRPPQPAVYLFLLDVSHIARESGYLQVFCDTLLSCLDQLPGDARTQVGFICYDSHVHYYLMSEGLSRPKEMTVLDVDDVFLPSPSSLLVNLGERRSAVEELLCGLPARHSAPGPPASALGAALQAAYKLMAPTGGRITVFQTCLPNVGPGALQSREDPNARSSKDVAHLNPATDFYKRLALDCSGAQVAVDLFLLNSQYADLATLSGMSKFSAGSIYHIPLFSARRPWQVEQLRASLHRYLTRKIGFEAVMRVRCTRGVSIHTFHGNFFVRSTDLLSLPNVSPDAGFGMQLSIEESLADLQQVSLQAALLYTSSKGERRIRVHTLALPIASTLTDVLHSADQECIIGLLSKMAVDRSLSASVPESREAVSTAAVDTLGASRLAHHLTGADSGLSTTHSLRLLPLYLHALLKRKAFRIGTSTRLDDRVFDMCQLKSAPLSLLLRGVYPDLYPLHALTHTEHEHGPILPRMHLTAERINSTGAYLLDDGETMYIYVCHGVSPAYLSGTFGVTSFNQLPDEGRTLPLIETDENELLHAFIDKLNEDRPYPSSIVLLRDNSPNRTLFTERLLDDRVENSLSYYEFLQHVKSQIK